MLILTFLALIFTVTVFFVFAIGVLSVYSATPTPFLIAVPTVGQATIEPTVTPTPTPIPTPQIIESGHPGVSIRIKDLPPNSLEGKGRIRIQFLAGGQPLRNSHFLIREATQDFVGDWHSGFRGGDVSVTDNNGIIQENLTPRSYAIRKHDILYTAMGEWGDTGLNYYGNVEQMIIAPVYENKLTDIEVSMAFLEVGVVKDGKVMNEQIGIYCQGEDIAGNIIEDKKCGSEIVRFPDSDGIARFALGASTYFIRVFNYDQLEYFVYDVKLSRWSKEVQK